MNFEALNAMWDKALLAHAQEPMQGERGPYSPIGQRSMEMLRGVWKGAAPREDLGALVEAGKKVGFWSDAHFEHENIIRLTGRPFESCAQMDEAMLENAAQAAQAMDRLVYLGDFALKNPIGWARKLNEACCGKLIFLVGNHDAKGAKPKQWSAMGALGSLAFSLERETFRALCSDGATDLSELVDWGKLPGQIHVGLSHWPVPEDRRPGRGWISLHGHTHNRSAGPGCVNCSAEATGYRPALLGELLTPYVADELARRLRQPSFAEPGKAAFKL